jgi:hypothetical protein
LQKISRKNSPYNVIFGKNEYFLNIATKAIPLFLLGSCQKPYVALIDGITMGGVRSLFTIFIDMSELY